jgi:hypothetical protein
MRIRRPLLLQVIMQFYLVCFFVFSGSYSWAQNQNQNQNGNQGIRHPRASELEKNMNAELQTLLRDFAPGKPFAVGVRIEPLRRVTGQVAMKESLPYYETSDEIKDEWDDMSRTDFELLNRVVKISVKVTVPQEFTEAQLADLKANILSRLPLVEGRDLVEITKKDWIPQVVRSDYAQYMMWILGLGVVMLVLLGLVYFLVSSVAITRISRAIKSIKIGGGEGSSGGGGGISTGPIALPNAATAMVASDAKGGGGQLSSGAQIQLNDSIKMTEVVQWLIKNIETNTFFPSLEDMMLIESYLVTSPKSVGGLLSEFPETLRKKIFSLSYSDHWLKALSSPGEVDHVSFELVNKLVKGLKTEIDVATHLQSMMWEDLMVYCWRLNDKLPVFLKMIPNADALEILSFLPRSLSIKVAREVLPGAWAVVLKANLTKPTLTMETIQQYKQQCLELSPLRPTDSLAAYKRDVELSNYLLTCDNIVEKEIYGALATDSVLFTIRPPFYKVLDAPYEKIVEFVPQIGLEDWAVAMMNVLKAQRSTIERCFTDRQKFQFIEFLKRFDKSGQLKPTHIGNARENIARAFRDFERSKLNAEMAKFYSQDTEETKAA